MPRVPCRTALEAGRRVCSAACRRKRGAGSGRLRPDRAVTVRSAPASELIGSLVRDALVRLDHLAT